MTTNNSHGSARITVPDVEADSPAIIERSSDAQDHDDILDDMAQAEGALDAAMRMLFGTRQALRELSPPSLELNIAWSQAVAQVVGQRTELLRLKTAFVTIATEGGGDDA